jgi:hypothetical protein
VVQTTDKTPDIAVLTDPEVDRGRLAPDWSSHRLPVATIDELEEGRASRSHESLASVIVLDGDDRLVSRAVTIYRRQFRGRERPLRFLPLQTGRFTTVASAVGAPKSLPRMAERIASDGSIGWNETRIPALRVTSSARSAPLWGFSAGAGLFFRLFETYYRSAGGGIAGLGAAVGELLKGMTSGGGGRLEPVSARVTVDYEPWGDRLGYLLASTLDASWLGLPVEAASPMGWMAGESAQQLAKKLAGSAALPKFMQTSRAEQGRRIHVDSTGGFVVDGTLYDPGEPHVLQLRSEHRVTFVTPD